MADTYQDSLSMLNTLDFYLQELVNQCAAQPDITEDYLSLTTAGQKYLNY